MLQPFIDERDGPADLTQADLDGDGAIRVLDVEPELGSGLSAAARGEARSRLLAPALGVPAGKWEPSDRLRGAVAMLVVDGVVMHNARTFARIDTRLFGPGDLFDGRLLTEPGLSWRALEPVSLAVLDTQFWLAARRWPALTTALMRRLFDAARQEHELAAICAMPRVEQRVLALMCHLACRWGRVTPKGLTLALPVTHGQLGVLIGARRPTVTLALATLKSEGLLRRLEDGRWLLPHDCERWPAEGLPAMGVIDYRRGGPT